MVARSCGDRWGGRGVLPDHLPVPSGGHGHPGGEHLMRVVRESAGETVIRTYDADDPEADLPLTEAEKEAEEEADRLRELRRSG